MHFQLLVNRSSDFPTGAKVLRNADSREDLVRPRDVGKPQLQMRHKPALVMRRNLLDLESNQRGKPPQTSAGILFVVSVQPHTELRLRHGFWR